MGGQGTSHSTQLQPTPRPSAVPQQADAPNNDHDTSKTHSRDTQSVSNTLSPSQLSLRYAAGNAVPASPELVCSHSSRRSARLPRTLPRPSNEQPRSLARSQTTIATDSVRTDELLQSFPTPPVRSNNNRFSKVKPAPKRASWSIFPLRTEFPSEDPASTRRQTVFADIHARHAVNHQHSQAQHSDLRCPPAHGESTNRNGHLDVPVDDQNTVPPRGNGRRGERHSGESHRSATPSLGARAVQGPASERTENERAIANGAHRYRCGRAVASDDLAGSVLPASTAKSSRPDHIAPSLSPLPVIQGPLFCKHKLAKIKARRQSSSPPHMVDFAMFDGSTGPSEVPPAHNIETPSTNMPSSAVSIPTPASAAPTVTTAAPDPMLVSNAGESTPAMGAAAGGIAATGPGRA